MSSDTSSKHHYQPAAELDDGTLARKREYWRSKKREQRARKSSTKKIGNENLGFCMSVVSEASNDPSLHYDVSFKQEDADAPKNSFSSGLSVSESNVTMAPCQKDSWFQQTKLNHGLPQFPETSTNSLKGVMGNKKIKSSDAGSSKTNATTVESVCPTVHSVPTTCIDLHPNSVHAQKTKTGMLSLNGKQLAASPQSHVSIVLPVHRKQNKPQNCLRPLTSAECKVHEVQSFVHSPITKRRTCAFASEHNKGVTMTEEEMVAKRRENWRIKKREQRAKRAAKLAWDREGCLGQGQPLSVGIMHASSPTNSKALRGISLNSNLVSLNQQSLGAKFDGSQITQLHVQGTKPNHASLSCGILQSSSSKSKSRLGNVLLRSKLSVLKQREQNKKSNQRHSITSSIATTVCDPSTSAPTPLKEEHVYPTIQTVFSIPEITPCISVKDSKPSPCPSLESHIEPPVAVDHYATTLQASMKKLLEESVYTPEENNANKMHVKCENESLPLTKDDLLTSEDAKPSLNIQQNVSLECDFSEDTSLKDIKLSPQASTFEDTSHYKSHNVCQVATDRSHAISPVALQPQCRKTQKFSDNGADPKQSCPSQALQEQQLSESDELQRKREYWRLKKRQQRARKANKDATKHAVLHNLAQTLMQAMSQDTSTCRMIPIQKETSKCTKPSGPQPQPTDKSRTNRSQIVATANPQQDPEEVIHRRRIQWRIKKQEQRARKAACERTLRQMMVPPQGRDAQSQNFTSLCSAVVQSITSQDRLGYLAEPCQPALEEEWSFAPNHATEGALSQAEWRNVYLMDFDPVNPLLVCMVCGEQQYSVSVEGVKAHIEEVHPDTLSLRDLECQGILDSWDKQVAVREHFITQHLQQRCRASTEPNLNYPVKIEAEVEAEDFQTRGNAEADLTPFHSFIYITS